MLDFSFISCLSFLLHLNKEKSPRMVDFLIFEKWVIFVNLIFFYETFLLFVLVAGFWFFGFLCDVGNLGVCWIMELR